VGLLIIFAKLNNNIVSINLLLLAINKSEFKSPKITIFLLIINLVTKKSMCIVSKVQSIKLFAPCGTLKVQREQ
jgi:hypothetical protein